LFAGIKRARGDKVAGFSPLPASRFALKTCHPELVSASIPLGV